MKPAAPHFAQSYGEARQKFLAAVSAAGLGVQSIAHPLPGHDGEPLAMDVVRQGPVDARQLLMITSACHGVEGFCGSGVQVALLNHAPWHAAVRESGCAVLYIHALNPHGFSHWRRVTQENVDLNRNWHDFSQPLPENAGYDELAAAVIPPRWPEPPETAQQLADFAVRHGARAQQTALSGGQYRHPMGIFYGGTAPTWSHLTLRQVMREQASRCARLAWIDLHTGLGPNGHGERIYAGKDDAAALQRARAWWGPEVTSIYDGSSSSALLKGLMWSVVDWECPQAEYTGIALEYGTQPLAEVLNALRGDHWLFAHPQEGAPQREAIRRRMRDAFYTDTDEWKQRIVDQGLEAGLQALAGLSRA
ncbi:MAG: M14 family metallopeptidase [Rubrivivax sp.]|nr:M14 family metallopeptidase [Rubrivivax sp.]